MMYIGTSLGGCLKSLMANEVSVEDVMFIVTRTLCPNYETFMQVVEQYYAEGNPYPRRSSLSELGDYDLTDVKALATRLYFSGRIHQPRVFDSEGRKAGHSYYENHPSIGQTSKNKNRGRGAERENPRLHSPRSRGGYFRPVCRFAPSGDL